MEKSDEVDNTKGMFGDNKKLAVIVGISMCVTVSIANGVLAILTRMM